MIQSTVIKENPNLITDYNKARNLGVYFIIDNLKLNNQISLRAKHIAETAFNFIVNNSAISHINIVIGNENTGIKHGSVYGIYDIRRGSYVSDTFYITEYKRSDCDVSRPNIELSIFVEKFQKYLNFLRNKNQKILNSNSKI